MVEDCEIGDGAKVDFCSSVRRAKIGKECFVMRSMVEDCVLQKMCKIINSNLYGNVKIGANTLVRNSEIYDNIDIGQNATVGVFAHVHNNCKIGDFARVGNFVELKKTTVCSGAISLRWRNWRKYKYWCGHNFLQL